MKGNLQKAISVLLAALMIIAFMPVIGSELNAGSANAYGTEEVSPTVVPWGSSYDYIQNLKETTYSITDTSSEVITIGNNKYHGKIFKLTAPSNGVMVYSLNYASGTNGLYYCASEKSDFSDITGKGDVTQGDYFDGKLAFNKGDTTYVSAYSTATTFSSTFTIKAYFVPASSDKIDFGSWYMMSYVSGAKKYKMDFTAAKSGYVSVDSLVGSDEAVDSLELLDANGKVISGKYVAIDEDNCPAIFGVVKGKKYTLVYIPSAKGTDSQSGRIINIKATNTALPAASTSKVKAKVLKKNVKFVTYAKAGSMTAHWYKFKVGKYRKVNLYKYATFTGKLYLQLYNSKGKKLTLSMKKTPSDYYTVSNCRYYTKLPKGTYYLKAYTKSPKSTGKYSLKYK